MTSPERWRAKLRQRGAGDVDRTEQGGLDLGAERLGGHLLEEPGLEAAGVVDEHVEVAEALDGRTRRPLRPRRGR